MSDVKAPGVEHKIFLSGRKEPDHAPPVLYVVYNADLAHNGGHADKLLAEREDCNRARELLNQAGIEFEEVDGEDITSLKGRRLAGAQVTKDVKYPIIYLRGPAWYDGFGAVVHGAVPWIEANIERLKQIQSTMGGGQAASKQVQPGTQKYDRHGKKNESGCCGLQ